MRLARLRALMLTALFAVPWRGHAQPVLDAGPGRDAAPSVTRVQYVAANPLLETLSTRLGISKMQAGRGVGAVLAMARGFLTDQDYQVIVAAVPEAEQLAEAAAAQGVVTRPIDDKDDLAAVFDRIGIPGAAAAKFVPVMRAWLVQQGADDAGDLVSRVM